VLPHSLGGYQLIARRLEALGYPPAALFSDERFLGSYHKALRAVVSGEADVTSVLASQPDEVHARAFMSNYIEGAERLLKRILFSEPTPSDGLILTRRLSEPDAAALCSIFVELSKGGNGLEPLIAPFHIDGFVPSSNTPPSASKPWLGRGSNFLALTLDEEDRCRSAWAATDTALGRDVRQAPGRTLTEILGAQAARLQALTRLARHDGTQGQVLYNQEEQGEVRAYKVEVAVKPPNSEHSRPEVLLQLRDITEHSPLEEHLFRLASFPLMHPAPMLELEMTGVVRYANPAAHEFFPDLTVQQQNHPVMQAAFAWARTGEEQRPARVQLEGRCWELVVVPLPESGVLRVFVQDVTARRQMELQEAKWAQELQVKNDALATALSQLREAQSRLILQDRLAALGTLTAGIAHELRNPLNFVNSFSALSADLCEEVVDELTALHGKQGFELPVHLQQNLTDLAINMKKIHEHGQRMERIIHSMLAHSRGGQDERRDISLNELLADAIHLVSHSSRSRYPALNIQFEQEFDALVGKMQLAPQEISQIATNLLENACYAVNAKGERLGRDFQGRIRVATFDRQDSVELHFHDNGIGIPLSLRGKILTPFFTTKPTGEGTGLGLSLSHEIIVNGYKGTLRFESEEGVFTTFIITLPR
jgi:signal transduction histidine kinase